jgi:ribosome maturation factor RimP
MWGNKIPPFYYSKTSMTLLQEIESVIQAKLTDTDYYLVDIVGKDNAGKMQFLIDGDQGVSIEKCAEISRAVSRYIDENELGEEKFLYEISSPGVDRPLKIMRQYPKHVGRTLAVKMTNDEIVEGKLLEVGEEAIQLEVAGEKKKETKNIEINVGDIHEAKVKISFKK